MQNLKNFDCLRSNVEGISSLTTKYNLIQMYCTGEYSTLNFVDFYYRKTESNAILTFLLILILFPVLFMYVAEIADRYLAVGMQSLSQKFNLSPAVAAVTLIAFANGAPDVMASYSAGAIPGGALISLGSLYGGFMFCTCLVVANVLFSAKGDITVPAMAI